jgi:hypothetical protein
MQYHLLYSSIYYFQQLIGNIIITVMSRNNKTLNISKHNLSSPKFNEKKNDQIPLLPDYFFYNIDRN